MAAKSASNEKSAASWKSRRIAKTVLTASLRISGNRSGKIPEPRWLPSAVV
jgi:hypothetical protein